MGFYSILKSLYGQLALPTIFDTFMMIESLIVIFVAKSSSNLLNLAWFPVLIYRDNFTLLERLSWGLIFLLNIALLYRFVGKIGLFFLYIVNPAIHVVIFHYFPNLKYY